MTDVNKHLVKVQEKLDNMNAIMMADIKKMLKSGMVDLDSYSPDDYRLAKVLVTAAMERNKDVCRIYGVNWKEDIKNLINM